MSGTIYIYCCCQCILSQRQQFCHINVILALFGPSLVLMLCCRHFQTSLVKILIDSGESGCLKDPLLEQRWRNGVDREI